MEPAFMETAMSTHVVMDIVLNYLKVKDLLSCREVSKFWNKAATSVLRRRSTMTKNIANEYYMMDFESCMNDSSDFPFAGLHFEEPYRFTSSTALDFFKIYGSRFTSLRLGSTWLETRIQDLAPFVNHLPRLSILQVDSPDEIMDFDAGREGGQILNLPSLRTLRISTELNEDVLREVFRAASSSKLQIEVLVATYGNLIALKSTKKLQAVSVLNVEDIEGEKYNALLVDELLSTVSPVLTKLEFRVGGCISENGLMKLLISSQHTLKYLSLDGIYPSQFTSECPVLPKLTALSLCIFERSYEHVFQGSQGHKFPALKELNLYTNDEEYDPTTSANFSDGLFIVPSLTTIALDVFVHKDEIKVLARCFPNVIEIRLYHQFYSDDPSDIWSVGAFKFLAKLTIWDYPVESPRKKYMNMDRFLTGMSNAIIKNLRTHALQNLMDSPFNEILRKSSSILQLKNLKQLIVRVKPQVGLEELPEEPPFISMVSLWYSLDMMPNLEARFVYEPSLLSDYFEEEEIHKAVSTLKAAFKHVQPYLELEPFFY